ncbi:hypothetical protein BpHYR1_036001 [Brachionus plicatilis]|uniref:Uncharacterized protein n=1 Tax=Brachionus plicatilis TaxID=10195 RepID=A0A3M7SM87_BRAPC|nr:hypothetical protein BpHYR1_036001 [Brachionus plicatilis]
MFGNKLIIFNQIESVKTFKLSDYIILTFKYNKFTNCKKKFQFIIFPFRPAAWRSHAPLSANLAQYKNNLLELQIIIWLLK